MDLILHGETVLNFQKRAQGRCVPPLAGAGRDGALRLAQRLRALHGAGVPRFVSSPFGRAAPRLL